MGVLIACTPTPLARVSLGSGSFGKDVLWGIQDGSPYTRNDWSPILRLTPMTVNARAGAGRRLLPWMSP